MLDMAILKSFQQRFDTIRTLEKDQLVSGKKKGSLTIREAGRHSFFEYRKNTYFIKDLNVYEETSDDFKIKKGYFIYELNTLCIETGKIFNFEWEFDDELEISMTLDRLSFRNLKDDAGGLVDGDDLDQICADRDVIIVNEEKFWYEDDWAAIYNRDNREEKVYIYEFENKGGTKFLTIEEWPGSGRDEYQIYTSVPIDPDLISIISKGDS